MSLHIATDGATRPSNPGPSGWAWVDEHGDYASGGLPHATNNIVELLAIENAIAAHPSTDLVIQYDSQYAANCVTVWGPSWRRKGVPMGEKANMELIYRIIDLIVAHTASGGSIRWEWVRGHRDHVLNMWADHLCGIKAGERTDTLTSGHVDVSTPPPVTDRPIKPLRPRRGQSASTRRSPTRPLR